MLDALRVTQRGWSTGLDVSYVFIPARGILVNTTHYYKGNAGYYWATTYNIEKPSYPFELYTSPYDPASSPSGYSRFSGYSIRSFDRR